MYIIYMKRNALFIRCKIEFFEKSNLDPGLIWF